MITLVCFGFSEINLIVKPKQNQECLHILMKCRTLNSMMILKGYIKKRKGYICWRALARQQPRQWREEAEICRM